jgi:hypothetical protein
MKKRKWVTITTVRSEIHLICNIATHLLIHIKQGWSNWVDRLNKVATGQQVFSDFPNYFCVDQVGQSLTVSILQWKFCENLSNYVYEKIQLWDWLGHGTCKLDYWNIKSFAKSFQIGSWNFLWNFKLETISNQTQETQE